jgi:hypothetical protein
LCQRRGGKGDREAGQVQSEEGPRDDDTVEVECRGSGEEGVNCGNKQTIELVNGAREPVVAEKCDEDGAGRVVK